MKTYAHVFLVIAIGTLFGATLASAMVGPIPPGKQYRLTIEGENNVTFLPQLGLPEFKIDYQAKVEYIVDTRLGKEPKAVTELPKEDDVSPTDNAKVDKPVPISKAKAKSKQNDSPLSKASGAVDLSIHSSEMIFRQNGQPIMETKINRSRFQGRIQPDAPIMNVSSTEAPPRLQEILKTFDTISATVLVNDEHKILSRKFRFEGGQRAVTETILSIHAPIPKNLDSWDAPTQLAMGQGQTAKGKLRFEKVKTSDSKPSNIIKVKVSGILKAEGVVAGRFIKDGTYTVNGDQMYDSHNHEWLSSRWSVEVMNELANANGQVVAHAKGNMVVQSKALAETGAPVEPTVPKL